jgi:hypothetical protein
MHLVSFSFHSLNVGVGVSRYRQGSSENLQNAHEYLTNRSV